MLSKYASHLSLLWLQEVFHLILMLYLSTADEEFDELCFQYGLELDEVVSF